MRIEMKSLGIIGVIMIGILLFASQSMASGLGCAMDLPNEHVLRTNSYIDHTKSFSSISLSGIASINCFIHARSNAEEVILQVQIQQKCNGCWITRVSFETEGDRDARIEKKVVLKNGFSYRVVTINKAGKERTLENLVQVSKEMFY